MEWKKNERGFTFISALLSIFLLALLLPFIGLLFQAVNQMPDYTEEISIQQFFQFVHDDFSSAASYEIESDSVHLTLSDGTPVTLSKYKDMIRRQVSDKGHEIYLRDIEDVLFESLPYEGLKATVTSSEGEKYVKHFAFYP